MNRLKHLKKYICVILFFAVIFSASNYFCSDVKAKYFGLETNSHTQSTISNITSIQQKMVYAKELISNMCINDNILKESKGNSLSTAFRFSFLILLLGVLPQIYFLLYAFFNRIHEKCVRIQLIIIWYIHQKDGHKSLNSFMC